MLAAGLRPYLERGPLGALLLGVASGFPFTMIAATLTTRLAESGIEKSTVTAFALAFLAYNFKFLWAPLVDAVRLPVLTRTLGQRRGWLVLIAALVMAAVVWMGSIDARTQLPLLVAATLTLAVLGATFDIVIDAYRIETLSPEQLGVGSGMSQYGWRLGAFAASTTALLVADAAGWGPAYAATAVFALPALVAAWILGEPVKKRAPAERQGMAAAVIDPLKDFLSREGALVVLLFILLHKLGDTLANLTLRILFADLGFTKTEVAAYDVAAGQVGLFAGIFVGGILYARWGVARATLFSLVLMAVSNLSFAGLAVVGRDVWAMAAAMGFENFASGVGGVAVVAFLSALCDLRFTATQFALLSAATSIGGRLLTGLGAGELIERLGYVDFYLLTFVIALPGVFLFWWMMRSGLVASVLAERGGDADVSRSGAIPVVDKPGG